MMNFRNSSLSSIGSNKDLPPVPKESNQSESDDVQILSTKTLKRKNFKQLSLNSNSQNTPETVPEGMFEGIRLHNRIRPAPLLNLSRKPSQPVSINHSSATIDPDSHTPKNDIINQFSNLDLNKTSSTSSPTHSVRPQVIQRKIQTVVSSISPTKSNASSPQDSSKLSDSTNLEHPRPKSMIIPDTKSPISTTSSIKLNNQDLVTLKNLGLGNSGTVSKILHVPTQKTMAKKVIHIDLKTVIQTQIIRELRILHECRSPYIIEFYGAFINNNNTIVICMEYGNCGSLDKILNLCSPRQFPLLVLKKLSFAILSGLTYLYRNHKIIHRDIKPSNVLMNHRGDFKLCDFGVLRELTNSLAMADTFVGTSTYMSPERIQGLTYGVKSDVWSTGLMLVELAHGKAVWSGDEETPEDDIAGPEGILDLLQRIVNETPPSLSSRINPTTGKKYDPLLCRFTEYCLIKDDTQRKFPWDLLNDEFLQGVEKGIYDKEVKSWAKQIRKLHKDKYDVTTPVEKTKST